MTKVILNDLVNLENQTSAVTTINTNNAVIETAFDNTLSRDGTSPNTMGAVLDMNSNQIINLPAPSTVNSPARLIDVVSNPTVVIPGTGTSGHVVPYLDGNNTFSGTDTFSANATFNSTTTFNGVANFVTPPTGVISSVGSGSGLTGGPITSSGTLALDINGLTIKTAPDQYADTFPIYDVVGTSNKKARVRPPRGHLWGLTLSNDVGVPNTVIDIAAGEAASDNSTSPLMMVAAAFTKNCNASWAVGTGNGAMDTGTFALSTWYHVYQIMRSDTGVVDYLLSTSATSPTMPTNYDHKRRIGSLKTDASVHIIAFKQFQDQFYWTAPILDSTASVTANVDTTVTLTVPTGIRVSPLLSVSGSGTSNAQTVGIRSPDLQTTYALTSGSGDYGQAFTTANGTNVTRAGGGFWNLYTNTSAQVVVQISNTGSINVRTFGWTDNRGSIS